MALEWWDCGGFKGARMSLIVRLNFRLECGPKGLSVIILGVVTGLDFEAAVIRRSARDAGVADRVLVACGLGRERARAAAGKLIADGARALLSFGIAGGLDPSTPCGTAVVANAVRAEGLPALSSQESWAARLAAALNAARGDLAHAPAILANPMDKAGLYGMTRALAADMESYGVGEAALAAGLPFAAIRVIADTADDHVPEIALHAMAEDGSLKLGETLGRVARSPGQIPGLIRLGQSTGRARRRLRALAAAGTEKLFFAEG